jgi:hypothetical protein
MVQLIAGTLFLLLAAGKPAAIGGVLVAGAVAALFTPWPWATIAAFLFTKGKP